jgi:hypothetical protein
MMYLASIVGLCRPVISFQWCGYSNPDRFANAELARRLPISIFALRENVFLHCDIWPASAP